jgi:hypothetical protein
MTRFPFLATGYSASTARPCFFKAQKATGQSPIKSLARAPRKNLYPPQVVWILYHLGVFANLNGLRIYGYLQKMRH